MSIVQNIKKRKQAGFTLLEVLLVVAIIAVLAGIVIIAINPGKNLGDTRNSQRSADVNTILNAVYQYALDNNGTLPAGIPVAPTAAKEMCITGTVPATCTTNTVLDMTPLTTSGKYLVAVPRDPQCPTACLATGVGYTIQQDANGRVTVAAPDAEQSKVISVTK